MRGGTLARVFLIGLLGGAAPALAAGWSVACGQLDKAPCAFNDARFELKQGGLCATGQFFDLIEGGTCWTCPAGYGRTIFAVNTDKACEKVASTELRRAIENDKGTGWFGTNCPGGQFWDIADGRCHSCPSGYNMLVLEHVHGDRKCAKGIPGAFARAARIGPPCGTGRLWDPRNGGECWSCPDGFERTVAAVNSQYACEYAGILGGAGLWGCRAGLSSIRNVCVKTGVCGKENQRPCEISERVPSCDAGLKEDFKQNLCLPLRMGETPFTGGLSSLAGFLGASLQARCKQLLGSIQIDAGGNFGVGARCGRDVTAGFACALVRDVAGGYTDLINSTMEVAPGVPNLATQMNTAANNSPCKELGERFAKTTRYAKATGAVMAINCPSGQFWDPDGYCYSCPADFTRTLFPVTDARACTDRVGGNLVRFGCGAFKAIENNFNAPIKCTIETLENGSLFERPIDLKKASELQCLATGELGYFIIRSGIEIGKAAATGDISGVLTSISKIKGAAVNALELKRLGECKSKK